MKQHFRTSTAVAATLLALSAFAAPAVAQDAPEDEAAFGEIVVTAQKREENLQSVPLAISVVGSEQLANSGSLTLESAQYLVPSLNFRKAGTTLNQALFLRGVGTINFSIAAEPSVAAVLDGVVLSRAGEGFTDLFDVERIEVLRGPQGTLFGKNASAGVVSIVTKRPTSEFGGTVEATIAEGGEYRGRATINLPMGESVRSRFTGFYGEYDGNIRNQTTGKDVNGYKHYGVRGVIEADLGETVMLTLRGDWRKADDDCCAEIIGTVPGNVTAGVLASTNISGDETRAVKQNLTTATKEESWGVSLQADVELGEHVLTSITSYRGWDNTEIRDGDWVDQPYVGVNQLHDNGPQTSKTFTQELRIASPTGRFLEYVLGAYYSKAESDRTFSRSVITCSASTLAAVNGAVPCSTAAGASTIVQPFGTATFGSTFKNLALFGQATLNISDAFRVIGGLRYTQDDLSVFHGRTSNFADARPGVRPDFSFRGKTDKDNLSGKIGVQFDMSDDTMLYASYTRGYKGPAYNVFFNMYRSTTPPLASLAGIDDTNVINAETVNAYEFGAKNDFLDGRATVNLAVYYAKYNNYQANNPDVVLGVPTTRLTNAGSVSTRGFELDLMLRPTRNFTVSGGVAYTNARVDNFRLPVGANAAALISSGSRLPNAPEWKMSLGGNYKWETGGFADVELGASLAMQSDQIYELSANPVIRNGTTVDGYSTVDASIAFVDPSDKWKLSVLVKNLFDTSFASSIVSGGPGGAFRYIIPREADRYVGVTGTINF